MSHFDEMTALLYLENQVKPENAEMIRAHASECGDCRELLEALNRESIWLRESLEYDDESVPARLVQVPEKGSAPWGWIAALALGIGGAYTVWNGFVEPWRAQAAEAGFTQGNLLTMLFFSGAFWKGWEAMRSLVEFTALATIGILVLWLLRKHLVRFTPAVVAMAGLTLALSLSPAAHAGQVEHGQPNYTLPSGQTIHTDLIVFADTTEIDGDVDGDVIAWSRSVTVNGHVKGDVIAFTQELRVNGPVGGNVRSVASTVDINSTVERNVSAWVGNFNLNSNGKVNGSAILGTGDGNLQGPIGGDLQAYGGEFEMNDSVGRNLYIRSGHLNFGSNANVAGTASYHGRNQPIVNTGAKFATPLQTTLINEDDEGNRYASPSYYWHQVLKWGASFVFGLALMLVLPGFFFDSANQCRKIAPSIGFGILFLFATPVAAVIVCITIVGLGVGITAFMAWLVAIYAAHVVVGLWLGERILGNGVGMGPALGRLALGLLILEVVSMLPFIGGWITLLVILWGLGALVLAAYKNLHHQPALAPAV